MPGITGATNSDFHVAISARALSPGEVALLTLTADADVEEVRVSAFGRAIATASVKPREWRALVGIDLDVAPGAHTVTITGRSRDGAIETRYPLDVKPHRFATRRLQVDEA